MDILTALLPVFAGIAVGRLLIVSGVASAAEGRFLFRLMFHVSIPALVFDALSTVELSVELMVLPLAAALTIGAGFVAGTVIGRRLGLGPQRLTVFVLACMIVNTGFSLPFVQAAYGAEGVARLALYDLANATLVFTFGYAFAARANPHGDGAGAPGRAILTSPPVYGIVAGLVVNVADVAVPAVLSRVVDVFAAPTGLLLTLAIGMVLSIERGELATSAVAIASRTATTLAVGITVIVVFGLTGLERAVLLVLGVAPVGFNTVTFASLEDLDVGFAAGTLSLALVIGLVTVPAMVLLLEI